MSDEDLVIAMRLAEPFPAREVNWKPQALSKDKSKALAVAYIDARAVMRRLDNVVGPFNWQNKITELPDGVVKCSLSIYKDGVWVTKEDVGAESEQPDVGDRHKAACSDSLKRAAVLWGIGRYLYDLPKVWCAIDEYRCFTKEPTLPNWALPEIEQKKEVKAPVKEVAKEPEQKLPILTRPITQPVPITGEEFLAWVIAKDKAGADAKWFAHGEFRDWVESTAITECAPKDWKEWTKPTVAGFYKGAYAWLAAKNPTKKTAQPV